MSALPLAALLMIVSGSLHATVNALIKSSGDRYLHAALMSFTSGLIALPLLFFVPLPREGWGWLAIATCLHLVYFVLLARTLDKGQLSAAYPIYRGSAPFLTALIAIGILGDPTTAGALAGIALIGGGILLMLQGRHASREVVLLSLATGALTAAYTIVGAEGVRAVANPLSFILWLFLFMGIGNMMLLPRFTSNRLGEAARAYGRSAALAGVLSLGTFGLALYALSLGPTAELAALRETGMITATVISVTLFGERATISRIVAMSAILAGALLILL
ncbi:DMT family transporter [Parasphingopyxis lamellibrachiae]|uniref:Small Multidrug Resistance (SMR) protein n=1 Tax=Parasphingopyxis lamellibrachiae TaxID=680125 RepID=A0A3D9FIK7_9SPHN|nr:DMT family transporter [Parasphingopyxis lamellibrachiae]RED17407.1 Small Multidrug Resistance (SMR) protein [Parasphingopyxis lamellibrachiae]